MTIILLSFLIFVLKSVSSIPANAHLQSFYERRVYNDHSRQLKINHFHRKKNPVLLVAILALQRCKIDQLPN